MNKFTDFLVAVLLVAGILTAWVLVPVIGILAGTGLLIMFFYMMLKDQRQIKERKAYNQTNPSDSEQ